MAVHLSPPSNRKQNIGFILVNLILFGTEILPSIVYFLRKILMLLVMFTALQQYNLAQSISVSQPCMMMCLLFR